MMVAHRKDDDFTGCPPECPLMRRGVSKLLFHILLADGNGVATVLLVSLLGVLGYLCIQGNTTQRALVTIADGQTAGQKLVQQAIDQSVSNGNILMAHESWMKKTTEFNLTVAKQLHIKQVPMFTETDEIRGKK